MQELLFLSQRIPYPPNKGDKVRSWHLLRHLAERYRVHLACFVDDPSDHQYEPVLRDVCAECCFVPLNKTAGKLRSLAAVAAGRPATLDYFRSGTLAAWARDLIARRQPALTFVFSSAMVPYAAPARGTLRILDMVDVDSEKWRQYAAAQPYPAKWIYGREARYLASFERAAVDEFDLTLLVTEPEARLLANRVGLAANRVRTLGNGVDLEFFAPAAATAGNPFDGGSRPIVFTGAMDYWPNVQAVRWFAEAIMPSIVAVEPAARFLIVGMNPAPPVRELERLPYVTVTGRVPDVRPYLAHADAVVAPLLTARGIQNKVLEAMAMAKPVVATSGAFEGIEARQGHDLLVEDDPDAFAAAVLSVLRGGRGDLGINARRCVEAGYGWNVSLGKLDGFIEQLNGRPTAEAAARQFPAASAAPRRAAVR